MSWQEHQTIWLQPWCENCAMYEDRTWCQDNVWEDGCEECGAKPVRYLIDREAAKAGEA
jgi:hypothetical protein